MMIVISSFLMFAGAIFILIGAIGVLRLPDLLTRMHAVTKAGTFGTSLLLLGAIVHFMQWRVSIELGLTILFIILTAPLASQSLARAAFLHQINFLKSTHVDKKTQQYFFSGSR